MTDDTYRVTIAYEPSSGMDSLPFVYRVYTETGEYVTHGWVSDRDEALACARDVIRALKTHSEPETILLDRNGDVIPQSVRA
jgi:hypothetical protein